MKSAHTIAAMALCAMAAPVMAGLVAPQPVEVTLNGNGSGSSTGDMVTARFSGNDVEMIGCGLRYNTDGAGGVFTFAFCQSRDSEGTEGFCNTTESALIEAIQATGDYSFITFAWDTDGRCTRIGYSTQSFYIPEHVDKAKKQK